MKTKLVLRPRPPALQVNFGKAVFSKEFWKKSKDSSRLVVQRGGFSHWESVCVSCTSGHIVPGLRERDAWVEHAAGRIVDDHLQFLLFSHTVLSEIPHHCVLVSWQVKDARCLKALPVVHCARYIISCLVCKKCEKWFESKSYFSMILHWMIFLTRPCLFIQASDWC